MASSGILRFCSGNRHSTELVSGDKVRILVNLAQLDRAAHTQKNQTIRGS